MFRIEIMGFKNKWRNKKSLPRNFEVAEDKYQS